MGLNINDKNYPEYKKVFEILNKHRFNGVVVPPEIAEIWAKADPVKLLNEAEIQSKKIAKLGLKAGLMDSIFDLNDRSKEILAQIDNELKKNNLPGVHKLYAIVSDTHKKVLKNKKIKNTDEYYIIKEIVIDLTSEISEDERSLLDLYLGNFEFGRSL